MVGDRNLLQTGSGGDIVSSCDFILLKSLYNTILHHFTICVKSFFEISPKNSTNFLFLFIKKQEVPQNMEKIKTFLTRYGYCQKSLHFDSLFFAFTYSVLSQTPVKRSFRQACLLQNL